jgi:alpha-ketoglutarate-dependent taurine dioxygenase
MKIEGLTPNIGATISGFDLSQVVMSQREELGGLLEEHLVMFFVGQQLDSTNFRISAP